MSVAEGLCDFISAMDTPRTAEWNTRYHLLNCGFPLKVSGETDFPCMSGTRVGQGRVYVRLGDVESIDFDDWCEGLRLGRRFAQQTAALGLGLTVTPGGKTYRQRPPVRHRSPSRRPGCPTLRTGGTFPRGCPAGPSGGRRLGLPPSRPIPGQREKSAKPGRAVAHA